MKDVCSIIIPHFNQPLQLRRCLDALMQFGYLENEVIIADNNSTIPFKKHIADYDVIITQTETSGSPYVARNLGISLASFDTIVLLDVNCEVKKNWLESGLSALDADSIVSGVPMMKGNNQSVWQKYDYLYSVLKEEDMRFRKSLPATNLFFQRELYERVGPFEEVRSLGDIQWTRKAYANGFSLKICDKALYEYPFKDKTDFIEKYKRLGGGEVEIDNIKHFGFYFIKNILPPSLRFINRFRYLNRREKMNLSIFQIIFFCWTVKILYAAGSLRKYREKD